MTSKFRPVPPAPVLFLAMANELVVLLQTNNATQQTMDRYRRAALRFTEFTGKRLLCQNVNRELVELYTDYLIGVRRLADSTVNRYMRELSPLIKYGVSRGYIPEDFTMPVIR